MTKVFNHMTSFFLFILLLLFSAHGIHAQLVTNCSFENAVPGPVSGNDIDGWIILVAAGVDPAPDFEIVADTVQHGNHALKVVVNAEGANVWDIQVVADSIPVQPGVTYHYSIWARCENPGAEVNFTAGNYQYKEYGVIRPAQLSADMYVYRLEADNFRNSKRLLLIK